jgi:hypothetical protein
MSTLSEREQALRRALFSAAESIEPAADGLDRIRARLGTPRPTLIAWIEGAWSELLRRSPAFVQDLSHKLASAFAFAWERFGPTPAASGRRSGPLSWLRPAAAMTVAIFVVAAGAYVGLSTSDFISNSAGQHLQGPGGNNQGRANGSGTPQSTASGPGGSSTAGGSPSPSSSAKCTHGTTNSLKPPPKTSSSTTPATTSPASTVSPSTSPTSPSPSPSVSPAGAAGTQNPITSGGQGPVTNGSSIAKTTAFQHYVTNLCSRSGKHRHKHTTTTTAKVTGTGTARTLDVVIAGRLTGKAAG